MSKGAQALLLSQKPSLHHRWLPPTSPGISYTFHTGPWYLIHFTLVSHTHFTLSLVSHTHFTHCAQLFMTFRQACSPPAQQGAAHVQVATWPGQHGGHALFESCTEAGQQHKGNLGSGAAGQVSAYHRC